MKKGMGLWVMLIAFTLGASAQDQTPRVEQRQSNQQVRIRQGWLRGDLTRHEVFQLAATQRHIRRAECLAKGDGRVSNAERLRLHRMQQRSSRQIYRERHDRQARLY